MSIHNPEITEVNAETILIVETIEAIPRGTPGVWRDNEDAMCLYLDTAYDLIDQYGVSVKIALEMLRNLYHAARLNNK